MQKINLDKLIEITKGTILKHGKNSHSIKDISTDTRQITPGSLFIALRGKNFDGHDYIPQAIERGAGAVCISDETRIAEGDHTTILVNDTLEAYQSIAAAMREAQGFLVVGITGSVGKTSTREMVAAALSPGISVYQTRENFNNEVGLPKTLLETPVETQVCIVEMGMRGLGEIRQLTMIAKPDIAIITNIGMAHIERLGSIEDILKAKTEIVEGLKEDGLLIYNANDPYLSEYASQISNKYRTASVTVNDEIQEGAEFTVRAYDLISTDSFVKFQVEIKSFQGIPVLLKDVVIPVPGMHNVTNALIGIAVAVELELNLLDIIRGLSKYQAVGNRQKIINHQTLTIIDDSYNAGLESMRAAIAMLSEIAQKRRKIAVLGGMLELGKFTAFAHEEIGKACVENKINCVFACGEEAKSIDKGIEEALNKMKKEKRPDSTPLVCLFDTRDELIDALCKEIKEYDVILIKGSRAFEMEKVTQALLEQTL